MKIDLSDQGRQFSKLEVTSPSNRRPRSEMIGAGIGKIFLTEDWDSPETNLEIQRLFEGSDDDLIYPDHPNS